MTLSFNAKIEIDAKEKTKAIYESISTDNKFYPENPTKTEIFYKDKITILVETKKKVKHVIKINTKSFSLVRSLPI